MRLIKNALSKIKEMLEKAKSIEVPGFIEWILFGLIAVFIFTCFIYWDIFVTTTHTVNYIESIFHGKILDLYKANYNFIVDGSVSSVSYDIPIYFLFIIWDLPLWIAKHFFNVNIMTNFFCMLWMKGILILFLYLSSRVIKNICEEIGIKKSNIKWAILIFVSSPIVFSSLFILSQYDIITIYFMLLGILAYTRKDENKFLFWFAVAIPMKLFALFVFIPLLLLEEKRVLNIITKFLTSLSLLVGFRLVATMMPYYSESTSGFHNYMTDKLLNSSVLKINSGYASLFIVAYVIICVFCYMKQLKSKDDFNKYAIYIPFVVFSAFFTFVNFHPYWIIYLTPFFTLILFKNGKYFKVNMLIDIAFNIASLFTITNNYTACFGAKQVDGMLISKIFGAQNLNRVKYESLSNVYAAFQLKKYLPAFYGVFLAALICMVIINLPKFNDKNQKIEIERSAVILRMLIIMPFALLLIYCYFS